MNPSQENGAKWQSKAPQEKEASALKSKSKQSGVTPEASEPRGDDGRPKTQEDAPEVDEEQAP